MKSPETLRKMSLAASKRWQEPKLRRKYIKIQKAFGLRNYDA